MMPIRTHIGPWTPCPVVLPEGHHEFVLGDVHGHLQHMQAILTRMAGEVGSNRRDSHLTFLGDLVDRGPDSLGCVALAAKCPTALGFGSRTMLLGNHESMMLGAMGRFGVALGSQAHAFDIWSSNGGLVVLQEALLATKDAEPTDFVTLRVTLEKAFGEKSMELLAGARHFRAVGNLLLCHAGIRPEVEVADWFAAAPWPVRDDSQHWAWVREPFYGHEGSYPNDAFVVHGHTPEVILRRWKGDLDHEALEWNPMDLHRPDGMRLGLDGGSYGTGCVAGAEFIHGQFRTYLARDLQKSGQRGVVIPEAVEAVA